MEFVSSGDRLQITCTAEEKELLIQRLRRIEGQVRGLAKMVAKDRYTGDVAQQASAIVAAIREVTLLWISQHLEASARADVKVDAEETIWLLKLALPRPRPAS